MGSYGYTNKNKTDLLSIRDACRSLVKDLSSKRNREIAIIFNTFEMPIINYLIDLLIDENFYINKIEFAWKKSFSTGERAKKVPRR